MTKDGTTMNGNTAAFVIPTKKEPMNLTLRDLSSRRDDKKGGNYYDLHFCCLYNSDEGRIRETHHSHF
ncbi:hypothetical protein [Pedobacter sp. SYSU D00535]|uniref:hypothetical protein n=1 Tax=Pedobacter sp. SYSU D00535 TaxID=2810308 RepID=UPI001A9566D6|nr:hypothetical protein [Pedobacter sp. SYSU D00535]